jgi:hypothetical protein
MGLVQLYQYQGLGLTPSNNDNNNNNNNNNNSNNKPVIIWATGTISKSLTQHLSNIQGKQEIKELQTTAILCTAHKLREVLM